MSKKIVNGEFFKNLRTTMICPICNKTATIYLIIRYGKIVKYVYECSSCGKTIKPEI